MLAATMYANLVPTEIRAIVVVMLIIRTRCSLLVVMQATQVCRLSEAMMHVVTMVVSVVPITDTTTSDVE